MKLYLLVLVAWGCLAPVSLGAQAERQSPEDEEAIHNELRALREDLVDALIAGDVERQLSYAHENVVVTWQNNEVCRGHAGLREFLKRTGSEAFQGYTVSPTADELTILYDNGNTGIVFGNSVPRYKLLGKDFELNNRWTATLVREDGRWLIASYHVSANVLDNPLLNMAKQAAYWIGGIALVVGVVLGLVGRMVFRKLRRHPA